jgi:hypothetical protein
MADDVGIVIGGLAFVWCALIALHLWIDGDLPGWMKGRRR